MATNQDTTTEAPERPAGILDQLSAAGVNHELIGKISEHIENERNEAIAKAARVFYRLYDEPEPLDALRFADELDNMARRTRGIVAVVESVFRDRGDEGEARGVMQLADDVAREMERLSEAFDAERWLAREREAQS